MFPALAGRMRPADPARSINGMFSFTPDAGSIVGESAAVRGFWVCEAVWVTHAGGMAQQVAEWMVDGEPSYDLAEADANRFYPFQTTPPYVLERGKQQYREVYDIIHPLQQLSAPREPSAHAVLRPASGARRRVLHRRRVGAAAVVRARTASSWMASRTSGRGAPGWAASGMVARGGRRAPGHASNARRCSTSRRSRSSTSRAPTRSAYLERVFANRIDRPVGSIVYTAALTPTGGIRLDLTITRKDEELFRVVTGGGSGQHDLAWLRAQVRDGERRPDHRAHRLAVRARAVGAACARRPAGRHRRRRLERRVPVHDRALPQRRRGRPGVGAAHQLRRRARLGAVRPVRDGRSRLGPAVGGRPRARDRSRPGAARSTRSAWRRATGSGARTSTPSTTRSRPGWGSRCAGTRSSRGARRSKRSATPADRRSGSRA